MNSVRDKRILYTIILAGLVAVLLASLFPLMLAGIYDVPSGDDYPYAVEAHLAYVKTGSIRQAIRGAAEQTLISYRNWQGTYSAIFLMSLQPATFEFTLYRITPVIMLTGLLAGTFSVITVLFNRILHLGNTIGLITAALASILCIQLLPSPVEGLYWFNGSVYYTFFHGVALLCFALLIEYITCGGEGKLIVLIFLELFLAGGNFPTALCNAIIWTCTILVLFVQKKRNWIKLLLPFFVFLLGFGASVFAPGNAFRQDVVTHVPSVWKDILSSLYDGVNYGIKWFSLPVLGTAVFLACIVWTNLEKIEYPFSWPAAVSIFSFCLFSAMFCPTEYALGSSGPPRLKNIQYFTYIILILINVCYWAGWIYRRIKQEKPVKNCIGLITASGCLFLLCCLLHVIGNGAYTSTIAIGALRSGDLEVYYEAALKRLDVLEDPNSREVELLPYPSTPYLLYFDDITTDPEYFVNKGMAEFYGKDSVVLKTEK